MELVVLRYLTVPRPCLESAEVFENVPLDDFLPRLGEHLVPVLHFHRPALGAEHDLPDALVAAHPVVVHDADRQRRLPDVFVRNAEEESLVEDRVQRLLDDRRLTLLRLLSVSKQPYFHVRICQSTIKT